MQLLQRRRSIKERKVNAACAQCIVLGCTIRRLLLGQVDPVGIFARHVDVPHQSRELLPRLVAVLSGRQRHHIELFRALCIHISSPLGQRGVAAAALARRRV